MMKPENTLSDYHKIDAEVRTRVATFAASQIVQSTKSRLTTEISQLIQEYARNLNLQ